MKRVCFVLVVIMVLILGFASIASAYTPTLPSQSRADEHSPRFMPKQDTDIIIYIFVPPVEW